MTAIEDARTLREHALAARASREKAGVRHDSIQVPIDTILALTAPNTDAEREALDQIMRDADGWWPDAREAILATFRRQGPTTDDWEYGAVYQGDNGVEVKWFSMDGAYTVREAAERDVERYTDAQIVLGRRRKAGPWEPVEADAD